MSKKLIILLVLAFVVAFSAAAFAEVQNVKVGGDLSVIGVTRNNLDLKGTSDTAGKQDSGIISAARIKIDANLTDNVDVTFRLLNERIWDSNNESTGTAVDVDLAYVTLKDFMKSTIQVPVNLMIGRQDIKIGSGLLIGASGTNQSNTTQLPVGLGDFSKHGAFDAIMSTWDFSPLMITTGFIKASEGTVSIGNDNNLYVADATYNLGKDMMDTVLEATYVGSQSRKADVNNYGGRIVSQPVKDLGVSAEYVYQTAKTSVDSSTGAILRYKTKAADAIMIAANYAMPEVMWKPAVGVDYTRLSKRWDKMQESLTPASLMNLIFPNQDTTCIGVSASAKPMDDVMLNVRYANLMLAKKWSNDDIGSTLPSGGTGVSYNMNEGKKALGNEVDLGATYDYTSDVQFGLNYGIFMPGKAFNNDGATANRKSAQQFLGSMKVSF
jgi:hypothetical protein